MAKVVARGHHTIRGKQYRAGDVIAESEWDKIPARGQISLLRIGRVVERERGFKNPAKHRFTITENHPPANTPEGERDQWPKTTYQ